MSSKPPLPLDPAGFQLDPRQGLARQLYQALRERILDGRMASRMRLPASRELAEALGVSRNTVSLALQRLVDKGFLVARERSGLFVNPDMLLGQAGQPPLHDGPIGGLNWAQRLKTAVGQQRNIAKPAQWQDFAYPFVYGQFDASLMPLTDWRAASQQSLRSASVRQWSQDHVDRDDPGFRKVTSILVVLHIEWENDTQHESSLYVEDMVLFFGGGELWCFVSFVLRIE